MAIPSATYRLQFTPDFGFADAEALVPYLADLGISHLYASPLLGSRRGSEHGYDVTDPTRIDPEFGGEDGLRKLVAALHGHGLGLLLDIVPNHMAAGAENPWWVEMLALGARARHARVFDVDWTEGRLILPVLGKPLSEVLDSGEIQIVLARGLLWWRYHERRVPLSPESMHHALHDVLGRLRPHLEKAGAQQTHSNSVKAYIDSGVFPEHADPTAVWLALRTLLERAFASDAAVRAGIESALARLNRYTQDSSVRNGIDALIERQAYELVFWRDGLERLNYRRFFDIANLAAVRIEDPDVYAWMHERVFALIEDGVVDGLRIDHVDGLADPTGYLSSLGRDLASRQGDGNAFIVVEKILSGDESLPETWRVAGTTGYEFLNRLTGVFVNSDGYRKLRDTYAASTGTSRLAEVVYERKKDVIRELFPAELKRLTNALCALSGEVGSDTRPLSRREAETVLVELTACLPVYRTYFRDEGCCSMDPHHLNVAADGALKRTPEDVADALERTKRLILGHEKLADAPEAARREFVVAWQQFTGPAMAKGFEDTALYDWYPLVCLNEVGATHEPGGVTLEVFHTWNTMRAGSYLGLNATSTHDTKRSEDARARLSVLSEVPELWTAAQQRWQSMNAARKPNVEGEFVPDAAFEGFIYQNLLAIWHENLPLSSITDRMCQFVVKAARERKRDTSWLDVNETYEAGLIGFTKKILDEPENSEFVADLREFWRMIAPWGRLNSVAQALVKIAAPGVPDLYQGTELFDLTLVDPDNRHEVDFQRRRRLQKDLQRAGAPPTAGLAWLSDPQTADRLKLWVTQQALHARKGAPDVFVRGAYDGLYATGAARQHVLAFYRRHKDAWAIALTPRFARTLCDQDVPPPELPWGDDALTLPENAPSSWINALTGDRIECEAGARLPLAACLASLPFALLAPSSA